MIIDPEMLGDIYEENNVERGGGGGGKKKPFGAENRGKEKGKESKDRAKENERNGDALKRVTSEVEDILKSDESLDAREVKAYFEWLKYGVMCEKELLRMKKDKNGDQELALEMMMASSDLERKFAHSSGPGGQNVNKTNSAVFLKHNPTKLFVRVQDTRDQEKNIVIANDRLKNLLSKHLEDWVTVIGDRDEKSVMAEVLEKTIDGKGEIKGVKGSNLRKVTTDLREGYNL